MSGRGCAPASAPTRDCNASENKVASVKPYRDERRERSLTLFHPLRKAPAKTTKRVSTLETGEPKVGGRREPWFSHRYNGQSRMKYRSRPDFPSAEWPSLGKGDQLPTSPKSWRLSLAARGGGYRSGRAP